MALLNPGEFITCENGHVVGEIVKPLDAGQLNWGDCAGNWRVEDAPVNGEPIPRCPCGAPFCVAGTFLTPRNGRLFYASFHIEGRGWVPPLPESIEALRYKPELG